MLSPCVARCGLNDENYCMGCLRHLDEIVAWRDCSETVQLAIIAKLPARKARFAGKSNQHSLSRAKWIASQNRLAEHKQTLPEPDID